MADPEQLPYLIDLLDDDSEDVQQTICRELETFGFELQAALAELGPDLNARQSRLIEEAFFHIRRNQLRNAWQYWLAIRDFEESLERGLGLLAAFLGERFDPDRLSLRLDRLCQRYRDATDSPDPFSLARFLFEEEGLAGDRVDYYSPQNSNLVSVLDRRRGIPISLCCIFILMGRRNDLDVGGCNVPGHFLACVTHGRTPYLVDCFSAGRFLRHEEVRLSTGDGTGLMLDFEEMNADAHTIIARVLRNLIYAFHRLNDPARRLVMEGLLDFMEPTRASE